MKLCWRPPKHDKRCLVPKSDYSKWNVSCFFGVQLFSFSLPIASSYCNCFNINFLRVQSFNLIHFKYYLSATICCTDRSSLIFSEILAPWGRKRLPDLFVRYHFQNWKTYLPAANKTSDGNSSASLSEISPMILRKWTESEWSNCSNISKIIEFSAKLWETLTTLWNLTREKCGKAEKMYALKALIFTFELPRSKKKANFHYRLL